MRRESNLDEVLATIDSMLSWMNGVNGIVREVALRSDVYKKAVERFGSNTTYRGVKLKAVNCMSDLFQKALAIFDLHWRKREKEILSHPKNEQWIIRQHIRNIGKKRAVESSKRNNSK